MRIYISATVTYRQGVKVSPGEIALAVENLVRATLADKELTVLSIDAVEVTQ